MIVHVFGHEELFVGDGAFVVESLEFRAQTGGDEPSMQDLITRKKARASMPTKDFGKNAVTIVVIEYEQQIYQFGWCGFDRWRVR